MQIFKEHFVDPLSTQHMQYNTIRKTVNNYFHRCCFHTTQRKTPQSLLSLQGACLCILFWTFLVLRYNKPPSSVRGNRISQSEKYSAMYLAYNFLLLRVSILNSFQFTVSSLKILDHFWSFAFLFLDALSTSSMLMMPVSIIN